MPHLSESAVMPHLSESAVMPHSSRLKGAVMPHSSRLKGAVMPHLSEKCGNAASLRKVRKCRIYQGREDHIYHLLPRWEDHIYHFYHFLVKTVKTSAESGHFYTNFSNFTKNLPDSGGVLRLFPKTVYR